MKIISSHNTNQEYEMISNITTEVKTILEKAKIIILDSFPLEISHHYGIDQFSKYGNVTITIINRAYCKKIIILFPQQAHPSHTHKIKEETFHILNGNMTLAVNGKDYYLNTGELFTIECGIPHSFYSEQGCIFEEISTTHNIDDSYYEDSIISQKKSTERKTIVTDWTK